MRDDFLSDVIAGLSLPQKALPPKYFYDDAGSRLFERICRLPEYYPTRAELSLTRRHIASIARFAGRGCELVEFGSGESLKTRLLLRALEPAAYLPIDISRAALESAEKRLARAFPGLPRRRAGEHANHGGDGVILKAAASRRNEQVRRIDLGPNLQIFLKVVPHDDVGGNDPLFIALAEHANHESLALRRLRLHQ